MTKHKTVLVTGGAGFIGSFLCESLLADGHSVICLDNFHTGSRDKVFHLLDDPNFDLIGHDVTVPIDLDCDEIFNLACPASPVHYQSDPVKTVRTNVMGALNLLELARRTRSRIFQASTSEVYGDPVVHPQDESYWGNVNPIGIRSCYDEGKRCAETLFYDYHRQYGVDIRVARIFNTYGPRMNADDGRVVSNFVVQALRNEPITLYGDGMQTRSFCYVDDLVHGIRTLMKTDLRSSHPVNLGNPVEFTMRSLAAMVLELTGSRSELVFRPLPKDDPRQRKPDISRASEELNWIPTVPLRRGLERVIDYFDAQLSRRPARVASSAALHGLPEFDAAEVRGAHVAAGPLPL